MPPDFNKTTVDIIAKRAGYLCSNPDCRAATVGPNSEPDKSTTIGEAAHIHGARIGTARFDSYMSDAARAESTNGIWLCRNCHKKVDIDPIKFPSELLFAWREKHESYVAANLGTAGDKLRLEQSLAEAEPFSDYPPIIRRIVIDRPPAWEWRLAAELMRHLNQPVFRQLRDLNDGMYIRPKEHVSLAYAPTWIRQRISELGDAIKPMEKLPSRLTDSFGKPGEPGDLDEIHHVCLLIRDNLKQMADREERLRFVDIDDDYSPVLNLLRNSIGSQALKLETVPEDIDHVVSLIGTDHGGTPESPTVIQKIITFELPDGWDRQLNKELRKLDRKYGQDADRPGCGTTFLIAIAVFVVLMFFLF